MFERFTDRARRSVVLAQEEARSFDHDYIGTEHLLLGLLREEEGVAARALGASGITIDVVRAEIEKRIGRGPTTPKGHIPFTPRAKTVLELALRQALQFGHNYIGTEHVLLGLVREGEGVAAQILMTKVEAGLERVQDEVVKLLDIAPGQRLSLVQPKGLQEIGSMVGMRFPYDEVRKRLEAIEARLSVIEQLLRGQRGDQDVS